MQVLETTVETNNAACIFDRATITPLPAGLIQCATCLLVQLKTDLAANGFRCDDCGDPVCVTCGCTDSVACEGGCGWVKPGHCSTHLPGCGWEKGAKP